MPSLYVSDGAGLWVPVTGAAAPPPPPPPPGGVPGGTWNVAPRGLSIVPRTGALAVGNSVVDYNANEALVAGTVVDAGFANAGNLTTFNNTDNYCLRKLGNGDNITIRGGRYNGQLVDATSTTTGSGYLAGSTVPCGHDQSCILHARGKNTLFELMYINDRADGISMGKASPNAMDAGDGFVIRYCAVAFGGDDALENDWKDSGTVYKCFFSSVGLISTRPGNVTVPEATNTSNKVLTLESNLLWRRGRRYRDLTPWGTGAAQSDRLAFSFFKWQTDHGTGTGPEYGMQCQLFNNIFREDEIPVYNSQTNDVWGTLPTSGANNKLTACSGNVLLLPNRVAGGGYPIGWPTADLGGGFTYIYGAAAKTRWNAEVNAWASAHPEISLDTADKGLL